MTKASKVWTAIATAGLVAAGTGTAYAVPSYGPLPGPGTYFGTTPTNGDFTIDTVGVSKSVSAHGTAARSH